MHYGNLISLTNMPTSFWFVGAKKRSRALISFTECVFYVPNQSNVKLRKSESTYLGRLENEFVSNIWLCSPFAPEIARFSLFVDSQLQHVFVSVCCWSWHKKSWARVTQPSDTIAKVTYSLWAVRPEPADDALMAPWPGRNESPRRGEDEFELVLLELSPLVVRASQTDSPLSFRV